MQENIVLVAIAAASVFLVPIGCLFIVAALAGG